jgi:hypothetical protein
LALDPARRTERSGERVFGRLVDAVQSCIAPALHAKETRT